MNELYGLSLGLTDLGPVTHPDGHDGPGLVGELVPGIAAVINDIVVAPENPVREPVLAQEAPDVFDRIELRRSRRQRQEGDVLGQLGALAA